MTTIRIGNDITIRATVLRQGEAEDFTGKTLTLVLRSPYERIELPFTVSGNTLIATWLGSSQTKTGRYTLTLIETATDGSGSKFTTDECGVLELVPTACPSCGCSTTSTALTGAQTLDIDLDVTLPANGLSAYELALKNGYEGTEAEWLASIKGAQGEQGVQGEKGEQGEKGDKGDDGLTPQPNLLDGTGLVKNVQLYNYTEDGSSVDDAVTSHTVIVAKKLNGDEVTKIIPADGTGKFGQAYAECVEQDFNFVCVFYGATSAPAVISPSRTYTFSFWVKGDGTAMFYCGLMDNNDDGDGHGVINTKGYNELPQFAPSTEWERHYYTFTTRDFLSSFYSGEVLFFLSGDPGICICCPKLEEGDTATPWQLSENDKMGEQGEKGEKGDDGSILYPTFHINDSDMCLYMEYDDTAGDASKRITLNEETGQLELTI